MSADPTAEPTRSDPSAPGRYPPPAAPPNRGRVYTVIGFVCAAVAVLLLPPVFGPAAIALGAVGRAKGDRLGIWAIVAGVVGLVAGVALGVLLVSNASDV